ncbi:N-acetylmuramoyl-L-alanine amidase [Catenulispora sp. NF23]|uniref:N-acetylmuramoyl-L-alanine amidase n=1 Tax=Catenulispora pinistramenti TaxID=2705254 RepID=A0ABS5KS65_9ACTN|nr:peptidoglycan recognition family protein [Catenulispora pinistramenti]MBS2533368.1 N-acetylmuramoyl-L-alanine amidase [Catenulispora pinistramenti]MBS2548893.1 N-acetylmuramoyl-L-alanine amidase [Catenulispora pinistramenti]
MMRRDTSRARGARRRGAALALAAAALLTFGLSGAPARAGTVGGGSVNAAFADAAHAYGVPQQVLESVCYLEGRLSAHSGQPSIDNGYGCMNLVKNDKTDTLDQAAKLTGLSVSALQHDTAANIRGGAAVLRAAALTLAPKLPATLAGWYGPIAAYSHASSRSVAGMYADAAFQLIQTGFSGTADDGSQVTLAPQAVMPDKSKLDSVPLAPAALPAGCTQDSNVDYPSAVDCVVPTTYDCNTVSGACTYQSSNRPTSFALYDVTIHDIEGTAADAISTFQDINSGVSVHYVVDSDGTVYQTLREKDIAYHAGNFWYNEHAVGIEHAGIDATGYQWYNATEYLASAKLTAYLLNKYNIPLDHAHINSHGTTPSPTVGTSPNHVDPGKYWLWDYYFGLIHSLGVAYPTGNTPAAGLFRVDPSSDQAPDGPNGTETTANNSFFTLYTGPSTKDAVIPGAPGTDPTDETTNVETQMPYYSLASQPDQAGTGMTMYEIWYGENDQLGNSTPSYSADAKKAWLAVPAGSAVPVHSYVVSLKPSTAGATIGVYGRPTTDASDIIGTAPTGSLWAAPKSVFEDGTKNLWFGIDYNHREAWVPSSEVTVIDWY